MRSSLEGLIIVTGSISIFFIWPVVVLIFITIIFNMIKNNDGVQVLRNRLPIVGILCVLPFLTFLFELALYVEKGKFAFPFFSIPGMIYASAILSFLIWLCLLIQKKRGVKVSDRFFISWGWSLIIFQVLPVFVIVLGISYNYLAGNIPE